MIHPEVLIGDLLSPLNKVTFYHYGNEDELKKVMSIKRELYPMVWYVMPYQKGSQKTDTKVWKGNVKLLLATNNKAQPTNDVRNNTTFKDTLNPLYDDVINAFVKNPNFTIVDNKVDDIKLFNYYKKDVGSRDKPQKRIVNDIWDVIVLEFNLIINNNFCQT